MGGRIYMAQEDVEQDISGVGAEVSFFVYADGKGLGAKSIRISTGSGPAFQGTVASNGNGKQQKQQKQGKWAAPAAAPAQGAKNTGARQKIGGPRVTGTVKDWKGNYGFIIPSTKVDHPDAGKKGGKIYFSQDDVEAELSGVGATVSFFLYKNNTGLGAMNVRPGKAGGKAQGKGGKQQLVKNTKLKEKKEQVKTEPKPLDKSKRQPVSTTSVGGTVVSVRKVIAWIKPDAEIEHDKFKEGQDLFVHKDDIDGEEFPKVGATVLFCLYEDDRGLGAEQCQILEQGDGTLPEHIQAEVNERKKKAKDAKPNKPAGKKGKLLPNDKTAAVKVGTFAKKQAEHKKKNKNKNKKQGGDEKKEKGPSGPDLPRTRVTETPVTGEVASMNKVFGWIKLSEPVEHELAKKHGGKIYLHKNDISAGTEVTKGSTVTFHIYADSSGLGAEECS